MAITAREKEDGELPSLPQQSVGKDIGAVLARWRAGFQPGPALAYPYPPVIAEAADDAVADQGDTPADTKDAAPSKPAQPTVAPQPKRP